MYFNMIKRVVSNELKVPVNQYLIFKTEAKNMYLVRETCILRVQDNKSIVFYMVTR